MKLGFDLRGLEPKKSHIEKVLKANKSKKLGLGPVHGLFF